MQPQRMALRQESRYCSCILQRCNGARTHAAVLAAAITGQERACLHSMLHELLLRSGPLIKNRPQIRCLTAAMAQGSTSAAAALSAAVGVSYSHVPGGSAALRRCLAR